MNAINKPNEVSMFKVGDWAGVKGNSTKWISKVVAIEYKTINDSRGHGNKIEILLFEDGTRLGSPWAAHATQEEIAAGHRIDLEELRGCDTSPNCKKYKERVGNNEAN